MKLLTNQGRTVFELSRAPAHFLELVERLGLGERQVRRILSTLRRETLVEPFRTQNRTYWRLTAEREVTPCARCAEDGADEESLRECPDCVELTELTYRSKWLAAFRREVEQLGHKGDC